MINNNKKNLTNEEEIQRRCGEDTNQDKEMKLTPKIRAGWKKSTEARAPQQAGTLV